MLADFLFGISRSHKHIIKYNHEKGFKIMRIIDLHCDTILKLMENEKTLNLRENNFSVDLKKLRKCSSLAQFFALFVMLKENVSPFELCKAMLRKFKKEMDDNSDIVNHAVSYEDILSTDKQGKIAAFLTIEEGAVLQGNLDNLRYFHDEGVRLITLTWNFPNEIGFPNYRYKYADYGLTDFGKKLIEQMNNLKVIIDVSHLSDAGFFDVARLSKKPFVASHSNAREVTPHERNLTDEMIKILSEKGGIIGLNFCSDFLGSSKRSTIEDMIRHIKHIRKVGGSDVIALGSDFDGISNEVEIEDISKIGKLAFSLTKNKFSDDEIEKILYKNALRVIKEVL